MDQLGRELNHLLMETFHHILQLEELTLKRSSGETQLTISEMHLIECVGKGMPRGKTIREIAGELQVKPPSVTVAVKKLEAKGFVRKETCADDGRAVRVQLTYEGRRIDAFHSYYHRMMINSASSGFSEEEKAVLLRAVGKLNNYFLESIGDMT